MCEGQFSVETLALLRDAYAKFGMSASETFDTYTCMICVAQDRKQSITQASGTLNLTTPPQRKCVNPSVNRATTKGEEIVRGLIPWIRIPATADFHVNY